MMNKGESSGRNHPLLSGFIQTRQYDRFVECCEACQQDSCIGVCHGDAGVGKTLSSRRYTQWDQMERMLEGEEGKQQVSEPTERWRIALYTPEALMSAKRLEQELLQLHWQMSKRSSLTPPCVQMQGPIRGNLRVTPLSWDLLIIDEADRVKAAGFEVLRDLFDRSEMGMVLIGMGGIEKRLARYPQFYSRVGFVHQFNVLSVEELRDILRSKLCGEQGEGAEEGMPAQESLDEDALGAIIRITGGNFRQIHRLLKQVERILRLNHLTKVTKAVVEAARSSLLFGREE